MAHDELMRVQRWAAAGGTVRLQEGTPAVVSLCRCDSAEEMERLVTGEADVIALARELSNDQSEQNPAAAHG